MIERPYYVNVFVSVSVCVGNMCNAAFLYIIFTSLHNSQLLPQISLNRGNLFSSTALAAFIEDCIPAPFSFPPVRPKLNVGRAESARRRAAARARSSGSEEAESTSIVVVVLAVFSAEVEPKVAVAVVEVEKNDEVTLGGSEDRAAAKVGTGAENVNGALGTLGRARVSVVRCSSLGAAVETGTGRGCGCSVSSVARRRFFSCSSPRRSSGGIDCSSRSIADSFRGVLVSD
jgi:hypothetical protein